MGQKPVKEFLSKGPFLLRDCEPDFTAKYIDGPGDSSSYSMIMVKHFDAYAQSLRYIGSGMFPQKARLADCFPFLLHLLGYPGEADPSVDPDIVKAFGVHRCTSRATLNRVLEKYHLHVYEEEVGQKALVKVLDINLTISALKLGTGDILVLQLVPKTGGPAALEVQPAHVNTLPEVDADGQHVTKRAKLDPSETQAMTAPEYYSWLMRRIDVSVFDKHSYRDKGSTPGKLARLVPYPALLGNQQHRSCDECVQLQSALWLS